MMKYSWKSRLYTLLSCIFFIVIWQLIAVIINNDIYSKIRTSIRSY
ncbi:hypothetical protein FHU26_001135 [Clostridium beijerinckii]|nr:hypothetical protein [Clostridium beijerinckii]